MARGSEASTRRRFHFMRQSVLTSADDKSRLNRSKTISSCLSVSSAQLVGKEILKTASILQRYRSSCYREKTILLFFYEELQSFRRDGWIMIDASLLITSRLNHIGKNSIEVAFGHLKPSFRSVNHKKIVFFQGLYHICFETKPVVVIFCYHIFVFSFQAYRLSHLLFGFAPFL